MKTFNDLKFKPHPIGDGLQAIIFFDNGYGASVVRFSKKYFGGSYTSNNNEWELSVIKKTDNGFKLVRDTHITNNVIGHLLEDDVTKVMKQIQELK